MIDIMARKDAQNLSPRINNRRALHDYHIDAKLECGMALKGTEVKSLRLGLAQLHEAFARIENGELWLYGLHIDPYKQAAMVFNHEPARSRKLLAHRREIKRLADATREKGTTLIPLAIYFNDDGVAKIELAVGRGKQAHDKRASIKKKEMDRDLRRLTMKRQ
jgi:SsrA-binding protein